MAPCEVESHQLLQQLDSEALCIDYLVVFLIFSGHLRAFAPQIGGGCATTVVTQSEK